MPQIQLYVQLFDGHYTSSFSTGVISAQSICYEWRSTRVLDRGEVVPRTQFDLASVENLARRTLKEVVPGKNLIRLTFGTDESDIAHTLGHGTPNNASYGETINDIKTYQLPRRPVARVLASDRSAVLEYLDASGFVSKFLIGNSDPALFKSGSLTFRLLHFRLNCRPDLATSDCSVVVFATATPQASMLACNAFTRYLGTLTGIGNVSVYVRPHPWFVESYQFPAVFPFQLRHDPPSRDGYDRAPEMRCLLFRGQVSCAGSNPGRK